MLKGSPIGVMGGWINKASVDDSVEPAIANSCNAADEQALVFHQYSTSTSSHAQGTESWHFERSRARARSRARLAPRHFIMHASFGAAAAVVAVVAAPVAIYCEPY